MIFWTIIFLLFGVCLLAGGVWLVVLGGSWYYLLGGATMIVVALLIKPRRPVAQVVYALLLLATALWAFWEAGFDWWPLASRLGVLLLLAIPLLFPGRGNPRWGAALLAVVWAGVGLFAVASIPYDVHRIAGELPTESVIGDPQLGNVPEGDWLSYGRSNLGQRYSPLAQITPDNVDQLELAWEYQTGDRKGPDDIIETTYQATPLKVGNTLYLCTPHNWLVALDADSGEERWVYDAQVPSESQRQHQTCRGVSYLPPEQDDLPPVETSQSPAENLDSVECNAQLFLPTSDARLLALDPSTGARCRHFAQDGELDLMHNMPHRQDGFYYSTSPPVVANGVVVVAGAVN
ncbi:PQQ-binding-like beta-propeller repeat protein, partial [Marinobacter sp.]|uniref:PQQ-binding-like beta-propeller repeat protein n=1 Tax=Marinobacter sp. TaxID=50741 RepID=UPI0034A0ECB1